MTLQTREKAIIAVTNAIAVYSLYQERNELPKNTTMIDFILKTIPKEIKSDVTIDLIDEVFDYVSHAHSS